MDIIKEWGGFARQKARTKIGELRNLRIEGLTLKEKSRRHEFHELALIEKSKDYD